MDGAWELFIPRRANISRLRFYDSAIQRLFLNTSFGEVELVNSQLLRTSKRECDLRFGLLPDKTYRLEWSFDCETGVIKGGLRPMHGELIELDICDLAIMIGARQLVKTERY